MCIRDRSSPASKNPEWIAADGRFNPTELGVQQLAGSVAAELATRYDIAGIVLEGVEPAGFAAVDNYMAALSETATQVRSALRLKEGQRLGMLDVYKRQHKHRARSRILGDFSQRTALRRNKIDKRLGRGVDQLERKHAADGQKQQGKARARDMQIRRERQNVRRGDKMDAEIAFPADAVPNPA